MRVGEMLLLKERIDPWILTRTLKEQATTRQRLVSILVSRALLEYDDGEAVARGLSRPKRTGRAPPNEKNKHNNGQPIQ